VLEGAAVEAVEVGLAEAGAGADFTKPFQPKLTDKT
jgi:hypothetical protein